MDPTSKKAFKLFQDYPNLGKNKEYSSSRKKADKVKIEDREGLELNRDYEGPNDEDRPIEHNGRKVVAQRHLDPRALTIMAMIDRDNEIEFH